MNTVAFNTCRPLGRAENITAVWEEFNGRKMFHGGAKGRGGFVDVSQLQSRVIVTDEFVKAKRPDQIVVMIAHGLTGGKLYGLDQTDGIFKRNPGGCELTDWYVTSSAYGRQFAASAAGIPIDQCIALGMPRTDRYIGSVKGDGGTPLSKATAYLYVPTFRSRYDEPRPDIDWRVVDSLLRDDELMVVKRHMNSPGVLSGNLKHVWEVSPAEASWPYLMDADVVATDFSSILFDALMLGKPTVLTADEGDPYLKTRGMYMRYPWDYGSRWLKPSGNEERFVDMLREAAANGQRTADICCRLKTSSACDGHSAERVAEFVSSL